jgi:hypothetical protein
MNDLVRMYLAKKSEELSRRELVEIARDLKEAQILAAPYIAKARAARREAMRQDGPQGFVMVHK